MREAARALRRNPHVVYATPNYIATASAAELSPPPYDPEAPPYDPNDAGNLGEAAADPGSWVYKQWNFLAYDPSVANGMPTSPGGIDAPEAWRNLIERRPSGRRRA